MTRDEIKNLVQRNHVLVTFTKKDGTERVMRCTLQPEDLPPIEVKESKEPKKENLDILSVYDLDKKGWRSFRVDSVTEVKVGGTL